MPAPLALLDEDTSRALEHALRQRGFDVISVHSVGPRNVADALVVEHAIALGRVVITHNPATARTTPARRSGGPDLKMG